MPQFNTITDVIQNALFRAGELTNTDLSDGDFYNGTDGGPVLRYINDVLEGLLLGSPLGLVGESGQPQPAVDWWWARKTPPATLYLSAPVSTGTASVTKGSATLSFDTNLGFSLAGWRVRVGSSRYLPRIVSSAETGGGTVAAMDSQWPDDSATGSTYAAFQLEYTLAADFLRFTGQPTLSSDPWRFDVVDLDALDQAFPISSTQQGRPQMAALVSPQVIRLSHYPMDVDRVEYQYIYMPDSFTLSTTNLILPPHYRRILSLGAAYFILYDKSDSKAGDIRSEFGALYRTMVNEHMRHQRKMGKSFGRINYRLGQVRGLPGQGPLRTNTGLIIAP